MAESLSNSAIPLLAGAPAPERGVDAAECPDEPIPFSKSDLRAINLGEVVVDSPSGKVAAGPPTYDPRAVGVEEVDPNGRCCSGNCSCCCHC